jgi:pimeloyl-ACP methyl ester carboxylesterase
MNHDRKPTIVIVHGAFADASSWNEVIERLQAQGYNVIAPPNPLRGVRPDSEYLASFLDQVDGPVLLVAHSYAGAVTSNAAAKVSNVVGLVYVAALIPEEGERLTDVGRRTASSTRCLLNVSIQRVRTDRRHRSTRSTRRTSAGLMPPTCPKRAPSSWQPHSGPLREARSPTPPGR